MDPTTALPAGEIERYSRQLLLPQFGVAGQKNLLKSSALIVGAGGLGCPAALYLAGAGVGAIGIVDRPGDTVDASNLHRQIAHSTDRVGVDKVKSAAIAIRALNPLVNVVEHAEFVPATAVELVQQYDIVLDCTDNVAARYLINDACARGSRPLVSGSAIGTDGQLTVYSLGDDTPCYRCVFPKPPPPSCVGSCDSAGVLGPIPGTIGTLQALECIKILSNMKMASTLASHLLLFDGADMQFRKVKLRARNPDCVVCGNSPSVDVATFDYTAFSNGLTTEHPLPKKTKVPAEWRISATTLRDMRENAARQPYILVDVRTEEQFKMCSLPEAISVPLRELSRDPVGKTATVSNATQPVPIVVICRRGNQSQDAVRVFREQGLSGACDVVGGLQAWHREVDTSFPLY